MQDSASKMTKYLKYFSLFILILQNTSMVLSIRYSRMLFKSDNSTTVKKEGRYLTSVVILLSEILKFVACNIIVFCQLG